MNLEWTKSENVSINLKELSNWFNNFSSYVSYTVLKNKDPTVRFLLYLTNFRVKFIEYFIKIGVELEKINNFNAIFEIVSGLNNAAVSRYFF
jgi:son of sevenless